MKMNQAASTLSLALIIPTSAFPIYGERIPNGKLVPNPEPQGGVWAGVGHVNAAGGGQRNQFGLDFKDAGFEWTEAFCKLDSDGDGRSNGEELGDPDCLWEMGDEPQGKAISHPGIADTPGNSTSTAASYCDDYVDPEDVQMLDISFQQPNKLSSTRTHYRCEQLTVDPPLGITDQFQVRSDVILSNPDVLHHIWIYHCSDGSGVVSSDGNRVGQGAYPCSGVEANCQIIAGWAVGPESNCEPPNVAGYIDFASSNVFKIEAHYDNAAMMDNVEDQSGMSLRLTPTPRDLFAALVVLGMDYYDRQFTIPARQEAHSLTNICPSEATLRGLEQPVWVYSWNPHMHLYGRKLVTEHYRCGVKIGEIGRIEQYEFDNQQSYVLNPPVKILPGDALVTTCTYNTSVLEEHVRGGEETTEEMCDNYLGYYPYAGTDWEPTLFTACTAFEAGMNPENVGYDDSSPFVTLDLAGDIYIDDPWNTNPTENIADCCAANTCESDYLADLWSPCGVTADCKEGLVCDGGVCKRGASTAAPSNTKIDTDVVNEEQTGEEAELVEGGETDKVTDGGLSSSSAAFQHASLIAMIAVAASIAMV